MATFRMGTGEYTVTGTVGELPVGYATLVESATLHDEYGVEARVGTLLVVQVQRGTDKRAALVLSQRFSPGPEAGFHPTAFIVPERHLLFIGAGTRVLAYDLLGPGCLWEDEADTGFWGWKRHGDVVVMSAELELAAWDTEGRKLWSTFVEPPWEYQVAAGYVHLDVMGSRSRFPLETGPRLKPTG